MRAVASPTAAPARVDPPFDGAGVRRRGRVTGWICELAMGARLALAGGRDGWVRTAMTAVGVGLGVAVLLVAAAVPTMLSTRTARGDARDDYPVGLPLVPQSSATLLVASFDTTFRDISIRGRIVQPEGPRAPLPPGVRAYPRPGELVVSPALRDLLTSPSGVLLRQRLPGRIVGTIAPAGLAGPSEDAFYLGSDSLVVPVDNSGAGEARRIDHFGDGQPPEPTDPVLLLLIVIIVVVLLLPIAVFVATAVRFGGDRRDRRLAALRLVGADQQMTRRLAAGEALLGALGGLVIGTGFFVAAREIAGRITLYDISVFPSDVRPSAVLAVLIVVTVPAAAVLVTVASMRRTIIEPLGVVRRGAGARRRLWWRLLLPLGGVALLYPLIGGVSADDTRVYQYQVAAGAVFLLIGVVVLLPWVVEATVRRMRGGSVSWQLAMRRLQLDSGTAARVVSGVAVAVAGAIALQMLFAGVSPGYQHATGADPHRAQAELSVGRLPTIAAVDQANADIRATTGVRDVYTVMTLYASEIDDDAYSGTVLVGDCAALGQVAVLPTCTDGDVFAARGQGDAEHLPVPGKPVLIGDGDTSDEPRWIVPSTLRNVGTRTDPQGFDWTAILATPASIPVADLAQATTMSYVSMDPTVPDAIDLLRNTAARISPQVQVQTLSASDESHRFANVRRGLLAGSIVVLLLIGASLLVTMLEQLRERRRMLAMLVAVGTPRGALARSVLWQATVPMVLGLGVAIVGGLACGSVLLRIVNAPVRADWPSVVGLTAAGAAVVLVVTLGCIAVLWRLMRPEGLRTE